MSRLIGLGMLLVAIAGCSAEEPPWTAYDLGTDAEFRDILFMDELNGWIVGGQPGITGGVIGRTFDGGQSWRFRSDVAYARRGQALFHFNSIHFIDDINGCMVGSGGMIVHTQDGGETWRHVRRGPIYARLYDLDFIDDKRGWAVGWDYVLATTDGGQSWEPRSEVRMHGQAVEFLAENDGWIAGQHGRLYRSRDAGETWEVVDDLDVRGEPHLWGIAFADSMHGWVVGDNGTILHTSDAGDTWVSQESVVDALWTAVSFIDSRTGWVAGFNRGVGTSYVLHTTDGGATWAVQTSVKGEELMAIYMTKVNGYAVGKSNHTAPQKFLRFSDSSAPVMGANLTR